MFPWLQEALLRVEGHGRANMNWEKRLVDLILYAVQSVQSVQSKESSERKH